MRGATTILDCMELNITKIQIYRYCIKNETLAWVKNPYIIWVTVLLGKDTLSDHINHSYYADKLTIILPEHNMLSKIWLCMIFNVVDSSHYSSSIVTHVGYLLKFTCVYIMVILSAWMIYCMSISFTHAHILLKEIACSHWWSEADPWRWSVWYWHSINYFGTLNILTASDPQHQSANGGLSQCGCTAAVEWCQGIHM